MKTKLCSFVSVLLLFVLFSTTCVAQEKYVMVELTFMLPKIGMESTFEKAVKDHNAIYHKEGAYKGQVDYILTGKQAGWYVWLMGPCTFTDLDTRPENGAHKKDWDQKVAPTVAKYGAVEYWKYKSEWSYKSGNEEAKLEEIWFFDIKRGEYYRFKALMLKINEAFVKKGDVDMQVYQNQFSENNGRDIAIVWGMKNWAEMDDDGDSVKKYYEEINGDGSWADFIDEWEAATESIVKQVWKINI